jgi:predicted kinase
MTLSNGQRSTANGERPHLVIFVGLPGSGKSTYYAAHFAQTHLQVSKDLMPNARRRDDKQTLAIDSALAAGQNVVIDNTNPSRDIRAPLVAIGKRHNARIIAYYFECSVRAAIVRNQQRQGKGRVPNVAIFTTQKKLQPPVPEEGFDEVHVIDCETLR